MAIKAFKEIIEKKGYKLDPKDRKIFERELFSSIFGATGTDWNITGNTDVIEFVMYDNDDNKLPQGDSGKFVRYIYLDDININKYFSINENSDVKKTNGAKEYIIDSDLLIKEAGYSNGIFKTQISLLNRRCGSEGENFDKLWIHEISPSRTEIRVMPLKTKDDVVIPDLQNRYDVFVNNGEFRDDTNGFVQKFVENINIQAVLVDFLTIKGKVVDGQTYVNLIKQEFKVHDFDIFLLNIRTKFIQAAQYFIENRNYDINSLNYGKSLETLPNLQLPISEIIDTASTILSAVVDFYLPKRNILEKNTLSMEEQVTFDKLSKILKTTTSDSIYNSTIPEPVVIGAPDRGVIANSKTVTYYVWSNTGTINYTNDGDSEMWIGKENDSITITYQTVELVGDIRTTPKIQNIERTVRCRDPLAENYGEAAVCTYKPISIVDDYITTYPEPVRVKPRIFEVGDNFHNIV